MSWKVLKYQRFIWWKLSHFIAENEVLKNGHFSTFSAVISAVFQHFFSTRTNCFQQSKNWYFIMKSAEISALYMIKIKQLITQNIQLYMCLNYEITLLKTAEKVLKKCWQVLKNCWNSPTCAEFFYFYWRPLQIIFA